MDEFYASLPTFTAFERIADPHSYAPLPDHWVVGLADVVSSTEAITQGRYKAVNLAGAAVISAVSNALGTLDFPYVFTGDGMCCAVAPADAEKLRDALASTVGWVGSALGLGLRAATISVAHIRDAGQDVRVARFMASANASYAMFSGGGLAWADAALKRKALPLLEPAFGSRPDLTGLSCRFQSIPAQRGLILSLIVSPRRHSRDPDFRAVVDALLSLIAASEEAGRPVPRGGPAWGWPPTGVSAEAKLHRRLNQSLLASRVAVLVRSLFAWLIVRAGRDVGGFSPSRYRKQLVENSDFRKYEDGLMMTIDCSAQLADQIEAELTAAQSAGIADFGLYKQDSALLTCLVPSPSQASHVHFVDGAAGGYALAARNLKQSRQGVDFVQPADEAPAAREVSGATL